MAVKMLVFVAQDLEQSPTTWPILVLLILSTKMLLDLWLQVTSPKLMTSISHQKWIWCVIKVNMIKNSSLLETPVSYIISLSSPIDVLVMELVHLPVLNLVEVIFHCSQSGA